MELSEQQQNELRANKLFRHAVAHAHYVFENRVQWMKSEFQEVVDSTEALAFLAKHFQGLIEKVEPPVVAEPEKVEEKPEEKVRFEDLAAAFESAN